MAGTPAEDMLQEECEQLQQQFQAWAQSSPTAQSHLTASPALAADPTHQQSSQAKLLGCFCWAHAVVERCSLQGPQGLYIAPQISAIPPVGPHCLIKILQPWHVVELSYKPWHYHSCLPSNTDKASRP